MRVLVATTAGAGHFGPLVPFAEACRRAGHEVLVAAPRSFAPSVERAGFPLWPCDDIAPEKWGAIMARLPELPREEAEALVMGQVFAGLDARATLPGMLAAIEEWRADVVLRETAEFGSYVAAERLGVPHVRGAVGLGVHEERAMPAVVGPLAELRRSTGLPADDAGDRLRASLCITLTPPSMEDPDVPGPERARFRDAGSRPTAALPDWWGGNDDPLVYVTFGSVAGTMPPFRPAYDTAVAAVAGLPVRALVTTGEGLDPASLGTLPANVHVERWVPNADVLAEADVMVCHGGFNSVLGGFAAGVPMVVIPLFADQPDNAARVGALGAGEVIADSTEEAAVAQAVTRVLDDPSYREVAGRMATEIADLPPAGAAVELLEALVTS